MHGDKAVYLLYAGNADRRKEMSGLREGALAVPVEAGLDLSRIPGFMTGT